MLRSTRELKDYVIEAKDGDIGRCHDFLFDDEDWVVRYMVADTGKWIPNRRVLLSPISLGNPRWESKRLPVHLEKDQVEHAPALSESEPVSRQHEAELLNYYGYPYYWVGNALWGPEATPALMKEWVEAAQATPPQEAQGDPHLRSVDEVTGYHIVATDGEIGHVEEFILDDENWALRYMVVDTRNWLPGRKVLVSPHWVTQLDWSEEKVEVALTREAVEGSPVYDPRQPVNREYETRLYDFYGRPVYWQR